MSDPWSSTGASVLIITALNWQDGLLVAAQILFFGMVARSALIMIGRAFGAYHHALYHRWPRLPWRSAYAVWLKFKRWIERVFAIGRRATGGFAGAFATLTQMWKPGKVLFGRASFAGIGLLQCVGANVQRHLFMYAATGAGKTTTLITILSTWIGSAIVVDPKGQIRKAIAFFDKRRWFQIAPYCENSAIFNVFDLIDEAVARDGSDAAVLWALRIAEAMVITPAGSKTPYFTDAARAFLAAVILYVYAAFPKQFHNLGFVRDLIVKGLPCYGADGSVETQGDEAHELLYQRMGECTEFDGAIAGGVSALSSAGSETAGNVLSTLQKQTKAWDNPAVRRVTSGTSTISLSEAKKKDDVVIVIEAPVLSIREELAPLFRLVVNMTGYVFEATPEKSKYPCLLCVDELPSLGRNEAFEVMLPVARSYGLLVLGIAQNAALMRKVYPETWANFSGEADAVLWAATNDLETSQILSRTLGQKSIAERDPYTWRKSYRQVPVMDDDQVRRYLSQDSGNLIGTRAGARAMKLKIDPFFKALPVWKYAADPDHKEAFLRRITRRFFGRNPQPQMQEQTRPETGHADSSLRAAVAYLDAVAEAHAKALAPPEPDTPPPARFGKNVIPFPTNPPGVNT